MFIRGRPQRGTDQRPPLRGRGPSVDQPAPGSARHIPAGSPEPPPRVLAVAILEQSPALERWERVGPNRWRLAGQLCESIPERERSVPWSAVGICSHMTHHDMKDVTDRLPDWQDRATDRLAETPHVVYVRLGGPHVDHAVSQLRLVRVTDFELSVSGDVLRFERYGRTMAEAIRSVLRDCEFAGADVLAVDAG